MSVRPREVADEASRFTLRSLFTGSEIVSAVESPSSAPQPFVPPPQQRHTSHQQQQLRFDLAGVSAAPTLTSAPNNQGLKFTLPPMRTSSAAHPTLRFSGSEKKLQAGYISGGFSKTSEPEIMRLNGVIDDLQGKLKKSSERIATAEQSVARGNAALQSERATSHARIVALASEARTFAHPARAPRSRTHFLLSGQPRTSTRGERARRARVCSQDRGL